VKKSSFDEAKTFLKLVSKAKLACEQHKRKLILTAQVFQKMP
jgi:hypothetical protein